MEQKIEPISDISGNIEVTFNTKNKELDPYEPILDQLVLTIGKTGRANRLTFENLDSHSVFHIAETLKVISNKIREIEEKQEENLEQDYDVSNIKTGFQAEIKSKIPEKETLDKEEFVEELAEETQKSEEEIKEDIRDLMKHGEIFAPESGKIRKM